MRILISLFTIIQLLALSTFAAETVQLDINDTSLTCSEYQLTAIAPNISHLVSGNYPDFKFGIPSTQHACFYKQYLIDKASQNNGQLSADVEVIKTTIKEPIYSCKSIKRPCHFCDPPSFDDCTVIGHKEYKEESVYLNILGLRFHAKSKL